MRARIAVITALFIAAASACAAFSGSNGSDVVADAANDASAANDGEAEGSSANDLDASVPDSTSGDAELPAVCRDGGTAIGLLFVTSERYTPGKDFKSVADGDALCKKLADKGVVAGRLWKAWLSDPSTGAYAHVAPAAMASYVRPDCLPVGALSVFETTTSSLENAPAIDEKGGLLTNVGVWTGTHANGTASSGQMCGSWATTNVGVGLLGGCSKTDNDWTDYGGQTDTCDQPHALYCFEQTH